MFGKDRLHTGRRSCFAKPEENKFLHKKGADEQ